MNLERKQGRLIVKSEYFNLADTLNCGQIFRYSLEGQWYKIISTDKMCLAKQEDGIVTIKTDDCDYFYNFFDLDSDYEALYNNIVKLAPEFKKMAMLGKGIRILRQDAFEMIISFIISANNNIPRIKSILNNISTACGQQYEWGSAFPTLKQLVSMSELQFKEAGAGYRSGYIFDTAPMLTDEFISKLKKLDNKEANIQLLKLKGVGQKVADCIMLFGLNLGKSFPVDTWIEQALKNDTLKNANQIREYYLQKLGSLAGLAQQYIFHYKRNLEIKGK